MPVPRYHHFVKRTKVMTRSLDDLDDQCLSRIIGQVLSLAATSDKGDATLRDNGETEKNLSLVSKRWYFLTQSQIGSFGVHKINLDTIRDRIHKLPPKTPGTTASKKQEASSQKSFSAIPPATPLKVTKKIDSYDLGLFRFILPRILKYKHIIIEGTLTSEDYLKLIVALSSACMNRELRSLRFLTPIRNLDFLARLLRSKSLGTDCLSISIDTIDNIEEVRLNMEHFKTNRHELSSSQISLHLKDQKFPDCEEKISSLVSLCRLADVVVYLSAQQRISIDCCHLMWSVGRSLQANDLASGCLFKISLYTQVNRTSNITEMTVPFGACSQYKINPNREDPSRHREIIRALKKDCYHSFVKTIRDYNNPPYAPPS